MIGLQSLYNPIARIDADHALIRLGDRSQMPAATLEAWIALYVAVGVLVALTAVLASAKTVHDLFSGGFAVSSGSWRGRLLILPRLWLLWQFNYLRGSPAILLIALLYANHIGFGVLGDV